MATVSPTRTPWTAALLLLILIWTVRLLAVSASARMPDLLSSDHVKNALEKITPPIGNPFAGYGDHADSSIMEINTNFKTSTAMATSNTPSTTEKATHTTSAALSSTETAAMHSMAPGSSAIATNGTSISSSSSSLSDPPLILYSFYEDEAGKALKNLEFFIKHGLHGGADFVFILNGETEAQKLLPQDHSNIKYLNRPNRCFDLGAYAEVLTTKDLYKKYKRFIFLNASIRGPFLPSWAEGCWSEMYLKKVTDETKLVGMTANCWPSFHVQSMIWATDIVGLTLLLDPPADLSKPEEEQPVGINHCFDGWDEAVAGEIGASSIITGAGYKLDVMMTAFHGYNYVEKCDPTKGNGDVLWEGKYEGMTIHPYDTMFMKTNRDIDPVMIDKMTEWADGSKYSSWDHCPN